MTETLAPRLAFAMLCALLLAAALVGGSAHPQVPFVLAVRVVAVLCLCGGLIICGDLRRSATVPLLLMLIAFAATMLMQLVPLPDWLGFLRPGLPGFEPISSPTSISLVPDRTWNALIALVPAFAALVCFAATDMRVRAWLPATLVGLALASIVFGVMQILLGEGIVPVIYEYANRGLPIGFFANRNHQAVFLAAMVPMVLVVSHLAARRMQSASVATIVAVATIALIGVTILVLGSRSGIALFLLVVVLSFFAGLFPAAPSRRLRSRGALALGGAGLVLVGLFYLATITGRATALDRLAATGSVPDDLRIANLPVLLEVAKQHFVAGSGFGGFDPVFRMFERDDMLSPNYFNAAHNDLIQVVIAGGILPLLLVVLLVGWWAKASWQVLRGSSDSPVMAGRAASVAIFTLLLASLSDYPLRTPLLTAVFALLCALLAQGAAMARR